MMLRGGRKQLKEPEIIAYELTVARSILGTDRFNECNEKDSIMEVWLTTKLSWNEIQEAVKYVKKLQYEQLDLMAKEQMYAKAMEESRKSKLDYVR